MTNRIKVKVNFFSEKNGGRQQLPPDFLSSGGYRPHLVVGDPNQKQPLFDKENRPSEDYLGVEFVDQQEELIAEKEIIAEVETIYPNVDYSSLVKGTTFTIREGGSIVGNGKVL